MSSITYTADSTVWDVFSNAATQMQPELTRERLWMQSYTLIPAFFIYQLGEEFKLYNTQESLFYTPIRAICHITSALLSIAAIPEALLRTVTLACAFAYSKLTGSEVHPFSKEDELFYTASPAVMLFLNGAQCVDLATCQT